MQRRATTKDELFLIKLHQLALLEGDDCTPIDRFVIGRAIGQNDKGICTIVDLCAKANFIKKGEGDHVYLTAHGLKFVQDFN